MAKIRKIKVGGSFYSIENAIKGYLFEGKFYAEAAHTTLIDADEVKLYIDLTSGKNTLYLYSGTEYQRIGGEDESKVADVKIGTTSLVDANHVANIPLASTSGFGVVKAGEALETTDGVLAVDDSAVVMTKANQGLEDTAKGNARANIAAAAQADLDDLEATVETIESLIPTEASTDNQLADKAYVDEGIATSTATFRGTKESKAELKAQYGDTNDYAFYKHADEAGNTVFDRYKYVEDYNDPDTGHWKYEYTLNNSSFTATQWAAINSGVNSTLVGGYNDHLDDTDIHVKPSDKAAWNAKYDKPGNGIPATDLATDVQDSLALADSALQYADIKDLTIQKNGTTIDTYNPVTGAKTINIADVASAATLAEEQEKISTLQGYFTDGKANKAVADGSGNDIVSTYATKTELSEFAYVDGDVLVFGD